MRAYLAAPWTSLKDLDHWTDPKISSDAEVDVKDSGRFAVRANSDDLHHILPTREPAITDAIKSMIKPGDTFVDAGANVGFYSIVASRLAGESGRVFAIEMMPDTAAILRKNAELNNARNITIVQNALSSESGGVVRASVVAGQFGQASISRQDFSGAVNAVEVRTTTLAEILAETRIVKLMKIDVEGHEERALEGAGEALQRIQNIIFESWTEDGGARNFLALKGYTIRKLDDRNLLASRA